MSANNICPYCGKVMKSGYLSGGTERICWLPKGEHMFDFLSLLQEKKLIKKGAVFFRESMFTAVHLSTQRCDDCDIILLNCGDLIEKIEK